MSEGGVKSIAEYIGRIKGGDERRLLLTSLAKWLGIKDYKQLGNDKLIKCVKEKEKEHQKSIAIGLYLMRQPFFYWIKDTDTVVSFAEDVMLKDGIEKLGIKHIECVTWIRFSCTQSNTITLSFIYKKDEGLKISHARINLINGGFRIEGSKKKYVASESDSAAMASGTLAPLSTSLSSAFRMRSPARTSS